MTATGKQNTAATAVLRALRALATAAAESKEALGAETDGASAALETEQARQHLAREVLAASREQQTFGQHVLRSLEDLDQTAGASRRSVGQLLGKVGAFRLSRSAGEPPDEE